ncbi:MAG: hypothetical protein LBK26_00100, partial [Rickettsiales bacterium]|nr:hypothetical protein [Rickettsiales bacterium]
MMTKRNNILHRISFVPCALLTVLALAPAARADFTRSVDRTGTPYWDDAIINPDKKDFRDIVTTDDTGSRDWDFWSRGIEYTWGPSSGDSDYDPFEYVIPEFANDEFGIDFLSEDPHPVFELPRAKSIPTLLDRDAYTEQEIESLLKQAGRENASRIGKKEFKLDKNAAAAQILPPAFPRFPGCPFETETECHIWKTKPHVKETIANKPRIMPADNIDTLVNLANVGIEIPADSVDAAPLLNRYKLLRAAARSCCMDGITYKLK